MFAILMMPPPLIDMRSSMVTSAWAAVPSTAAMAQLSRTLVA